jgi:hypothetical protein
MPKFPQPKDPKGTKKPPKRVKPAKGPKGQAQSIMGNMLNGGCGDGE